MDVIRIILVVFIVFSSDNSMFKNVHILKFPELKSSDGKILKIIVTDDFDFELYKKHSDSGKLPKAIYSVVIRGN
ncbi:MAG: hypothetical protein U9Q66_03105 [Patescibacteria group bacterium]|nr:hypothetical protein [Patescibacteria group bacterium]